MPRQRTAVRSAEVPPPPRTPIDIGKTKLRFSGHESFACRYAWLPKAYRALADDPTALADDERAMVELGVGKNMVRSIRFWIDVMGVATPQRGRVLNITPFGRAIFAVGGHDPYLEDVRTLWLLHWNLSSHVDDGVFAWRYLLNQWPHAEVTRSEALTAFGRESGRLGSQHSEVTLGQHFDVFLHTYVPSRTVTTALEDSLDCPLVDLGLLQYAGDRRVGGTGRREAVYAFNRGSKPEITTPLFEYCLHDFWRRWHPTELTLTIRDVAVSLCSVGQVFKLPEDDVRARLEVYATSNQKLSFSYRPSAVQGLITRRDRRGYDFLAAIYNADDRVGTS